MFTHWLRAWGCLTGYFTCLDRDGSRYDDSKYMWLQGRQVYTFSRLVNECDTASPETRARWLQIAQLGVDFLPHGKGFLPGEMPIALREGVGGLTLFWRWCGRHEWRGGGPSQRGTPTRIVFLCAGVDVHGLGAYRVHITPVELCRTHAPPPIPPCPCPVRSSTLAPVATAHTKPTFNASPTPRCPPSLP